LPAANPVPEIWPWEAKEGGARIVATGRSDFPNQINNSIGFPAVFRGVLTVRAKKMTDEMFLAAAHAIAKYSEETGIHEERIIGSMTETELYVKEAMAVAEKAMELGYARRKISRDELEHEVRSLIERSSKYMDVALKAGLIATHPPI
jgi:malate dehydrogenase (oxaloacetate-decarboxylating)